MAVGCYKFTVPSVNDGQTVKTYLRRECGLSARSMTVLKYEGGGIMRGGSLLHAHDIVHEGDVVHIVLPREENLILPSKGALTILYEDDRLLVVDKPPFMPVHPTKAHQTDTLANLISFYQRERGEDYTFRALNRLDRDTSGCVILAKDRIAYTLVQPTVKKTYIAVCEGLIGEAGVIDRPIGLMPGSTMRRCVREDGARAVTCYQPLRHSNDHTLLRLWLETGRTHQIRCHMSSIGHPLAGDDLYGGRREYLTRQALHCHTVSFRHPDTKEIIRINAGIPREFSLPLSGNGSFDTDLFPAVDPSDAAEQTE